ncbi:MAG TPA: MBL fold metallo-hydrolase [Longimicrobiales bacterium]|nr:MBL fold metallo-hydrolase [Longimicrobiales bacterium]
MAPHDRLGRRAFLRRAGSCAAHVALMGWAAPASARARWTAQARHPVVAEEPWGRLEQLDEGIWALVSTPLEDRTTLCNGGIVAGRNGVALLEGFASQAGARWMAEQARRLTGRSATHVVLTHYHADHSAGLGGAAGEGRRVLTTGITRDLTRERVQGVPAELLEEVALVDARRPSELDLGDRSLLLVPRRGHTASDVSVEIPDASVVFCGDLVWNGMFPNYVDAAPSRLSSEARLLRTTGARVYVPGHGPLADAAALDAYLGLLDHVEEAARDALRRGLSAEEAGAAYRLPPGLEDWTLFSPGYFARAIGAWLTELMA